MGDPGKTAATESGDTAAGVTQRRKLTANDRKSIDKQTPVANTVRVRGIVADPTGRPVPGAPVFLRTEVQSPEGEDERPLFAYTYVGQDYDVGLTIRRHPASCSGSSFRSSGHRHWC